GGAARQQDPRHLRPPRRARRQAAIFATHAARMELPPAFVVASVARAAQYVVWRSRAGVEDAVIRCGWGVRLEKDISTITAPRRAMVLAAGLGTRMRPHNGAIPKPLVTVGGKSLIDYVLDRLAQAGVERVVVNVHHLADQ